MNTNEQKQISSEQNIEKKGSNSAGDSKDVTKPTEEQPKDTPPKPKVKDFDAAGVSLVEDEWAQYYDENGTQHKIKRFTWRNRNNIQIQVINYGARVISIKLPDRKGEIEDVLLGFDDLAGYLFYDKFYFGSIIGRVSNVIKNGTFVIGNKKYSISSNYENHSIHGGWKGLDKMVWDTYITGKKVIMSHISPHLTEGYPGDLLVRVVFELSAKNEFKVSFDAQSTRPTCIDLSHLLYFNLSGHHKGPDEIYRHILTLNCNCFTPQANNIPTGEILNVIHSQFDFQVPKLLGKVMGIVPKDGFNQNLCVNRGMYQGECFVGRLLHPPSGRMIEVYSNQPGVQLNTANDFGYGNILSMEDIVKSQTEVKGCSISVEKVDKSMLLYQKVHEKVVDVLKLDEQQNFDEMKDLIRKFLLLKPKNDSESKTKVTEQVFKVTPMQNDYLVKAREIVCENEETDDECLDLKDVLSAVLKIVEIEEPPAALPSKTLSTGADLMPKASSTSKGTSAVNAPMSKSPDSSKAALRSSKGALPTSKTGYEQSSERVIKESSATTKDASPKQSKSASMKESLNVIPVYYKNSDQIRGKGRALYKMHGAIALQTQNYPNAVNIKHFPTTTLNPGEVYRHDIVYRFWIRAGNPNKWIKRNLNESKPKVIK